jgi:predicted kinase
MLIVFSGLPATGKTSIAKALVEKRHFCYLRIDEIEHQILKADSSTSDIGSIGYDIAYALALSNLKLGNTVIADCVNPISESREKWRTVAEQSNTSIIEIEIICSDQIEHRRRAETRIADIPHFKLPDWNAVVKREYNIRNDPRLVIDTTELSIQESVAQIEAYIATF